VSIVQDIELERLFVIVPIIGIANFSVLLVPVPEISCYSSAIMKNSAKKAPRQDSAAPAPTRPAAPGSHKFHVGQAVYFTAGTMGRPGASGSYQIVRLLPSDGDEHHYRIKSAGEAFERVAKESQLERDR
jgi:hypothetical protein